MTQLRGFRVGVTSDRRADDLIAALERRGAQVLHAPALTIAPNEQDGSLVGDTRAVISARPEVVLVTRAARHARPNALILFTALASSDSVVSRPELVDKLPDPLDDHALEVAMSRLRRALGVPGLITTVVKRGYRFNAARVD